MSVHVARFSRFACLFVIVMFAIGSISSMAAAASEKPNVIIIYTDDQGSLDTNLYGSKDLITPGMDRLAREGVRFTQMYAPSVLLLALSRRADDGPLSRSGRRGEQLPFDSQQPGHA